MNCVIIFPSKNTVILYFDSGAEGDYLAHVTFFARAKQVMILRSEWYKQIFPHTGPKVPHSRLAPKRKYDIFGLDVRKNSIRSTGVKLVSPQLVFATLAFGSAVNLHEL